MADHNPADIVSLAEYLSTNAPGHHVLALNHPENPNDIIEVLVRSNGKGQEVQSLKPLLDEYRTHPVRVRGCANITDLSSFIEHVQRFKDADTVIFADTTFGSASILAVYDYHQPRFVACVEDPEFPADDPKVGDSLMSFRRGEARYMGHRAIYRFPFSKEWKAWNAQNGKPMSQGDFAEFLEDRILDVINPPTPDELNGTVLGQISASLGAHYADAAKLMALSREFAVHSRESVKNAQNLSTGEMTIEYQAENVDKQGLPLKVPNLFMIGIRVFERGEPWRIPVRLRFRVSGGTIRWHYEMFRTEQVGDEAISEALARVRENTGVPLLIGSPEA
jgi:uncharacterized protein YfdQ (DUF2303 family)